MGSKLCGAVCTLLRTEDAPTMTEYALMIALIAIVSLAALTTMGSEISTVFSTLKDSLAAVI